MGFRGTSFSHMKTKFPVIRFWWIIDRMTAPHHGFKQQNHIISDNTLPHAIHLGERPKVLVIACECDTLDDNHRCPFFPSRQRLSILWFYVDLHLQYYLFCIIEYIQVMYICYSANYRSSKEKCISNCNKTTYHFSANLLKDIPNFVWGFDFKSHDISFHIPADHCDTFWRRTRIIISQNRYRSCWGTGDDRSQNISSDGNNLS